VALRRRVLRLVRRSRAERRRLLPALVAERVQQLPGRKRRGAPSRGRPPISP